MDVEKIRQREQLAEAYASFSQSRNGLGKVLGGVVGIVIILTGTLAGGGAFTGALTIGATLFWLVGKEILRARLYRPYGEAVETWTAENRRQHLWVTGFVALISLGIVGFVLLNAEIDTAGDWIYLFFAIAMPFITWRFLRTPLEFIVGVFLLAACAVHGAGGAYSLLPSGEMSLADIGMVLATWSPFIGAFYLIAAGIREHQAFQQLSRQMESL